MNMEKKILEILRTVLEMPTIDETCSQQNCDNWDSLHHLNLIIELQMEFDISLEPEEIAEMHSYEDVVKMVKSKL